MTTEILFFFSFLFYTGVLLINNVVLLSGVHKSDSVIHVYVSILRTLGLHNYTL